MLYELFRGRFRVVWIILGASSHVLSSNQRQTRLLKKKKKKRLKLFRIMPILLAKAFLKQLAVWVCCLTTSGKQTSHLTPTDNELTSPSQWTDICMAPRISHCSPYTSRKHHMAYYIGVISNFWNYVGHSFREVGRCDILDAKVFHSWRPESNFHVSTALVAMT